MTLLPRLYAIADASFGDPVRLARSLILGGAQLIQLRTKSAGARELLGHVEGVLELAPPDVRIIVNDRVDIARITSAAGVHLGQTDLAPAAARTVLGAERIVGFSTHNLSQALEADKLPIDYISVGPVFPTFTKQNPDPVVGLEGLATIAEAVHKPVVAIGGIKLKNAAEVLEAGAHSIAVIRDLLDCADVQRRTREWMDILDCSGAL
jgi:thiamine-phosphate pyrophosphorylase